MSGAKDILAKGTSALKDVASRFLSWGVKVVIITLGGKGVFFATQTDKEGKHLEALKAEVVDTTAAGDTFVGAFAVRMALGREGTYWSDEQVQEATTFGIIASAKTVERRGAQDSIPYLQEIALWETMVQDWGLAL